VLPAQDGSPVLPTQKGVTARLYRADATPTVVDVGDWPELCRDDDNLLWVDLENPSDDLLAAVASLFKVDPRAARLTRRPQTRPVVRSYSDYYAVTVFTVDVDESPVKRGYEPLTTVTEINAVAGRNFLLSVHSGPLPWFKELEERTATNSGLGRLDSSYLLYVLLDTLVADYVREFDAVEDEVERLEERLLRDSGRHALNDVMLMKRHIHALRRIIGPHRQALGFLVAADSPVPQPQVEAYFRDLIQHLDNLSARLDHARDTVTGSYNLYISNISYRTNEELRVLTFLSAVLLPMTVITGVFGTNFHLGEYDFMEGFYVMLVGMAVMAAGMLVFFRWRKWL
jgi:magnesium transporter